MSSQLNSNFRKSIISFSWTWIGLLIFIGIISLFSIWYMNRLYNQGAIESERINMLSNEVLTAQIEFKIQVQEWKNILLRGYDISDKKKYFSEFEKKETSVRDRLNNASIMAEQLGLVSESEKIKKITEHHVAQGLIYKTTLDKTSFETYENIQKADQSVKGADRELEALLSGVSNEISKINTSQREAMQDSLNQRYLSLRKLILIIMTIALVITGVSLYGVLRATRT